MTSTPYNNTAYNGFVLPDTSSYAFACRKKTEMVLRGRVEAAFCKQLVFITLTYDRQHLPTTYKDVKSLKIFKKRETRKRICKVNSPLYNIKVSENGKTKKKLRSYSEWYDLALTRYSNKDVTISQAFEYVPIAETNQVYLDYDSYDGKKWITSKSRPLNLKDNKYRKFEVMSEQDFKNAKFNWMHSDDKQKDYYGLLVPQHLSDFLGLMRDAVRVHCNDKNLHLRFLANGEYGQTKGCTHRPHYHILIFSNYIDFDWDSHMRLFWNKARILQCDVVDSSDANSTKRITSYVYAHTAKVDDGNRYQNELSPTFRLMSTYDGGIGFQLCKPELMKNVKDPFIRSLSFSLSAWDKKSSIKFQTRDDSGKVFDYEIPRFFKDRILNYKNLDTRTLTQSMCNAARGLIENFCRYANIFGKFDLLTVFHNLGLCGTPKDVLTFFYINNHEFLAKKFGNIKTYSYFCDKFLQGLSDADKVKRQVYRERFAHRKQQKKYDLAARKFEEL